MPLAGARATEMLVWQGQTVQLKPRLLGLGGSGQGARLSPPQPRFSLARSLPAGGLQCEDLEIPSSDVCAKVSPHMVVMTFCVRGMWVTVHTSVR